MKTPVLLITFNRPAYVRQMVKALKAAEVENLFVFKDGPRPDNDEDFAASGEIERIIASIDWKCHVTTNYMANNLGCGYGPYSAISWAFQYVERLIILEDDCIPTLPFFEFCTEMLERYADNPKVRQITGRSPLMESPVFEKYDYIFSQYAPTLGWATWKRTWLNFDMQMRSLVPFFEKGGFTDQFASKEEADFFNRRYRKIKDDYSIVFHVWDYQYGLFSRTDGSLGIVPALNLIKYIGMEGTHSSSPDEEICRLDASVEFKAGRMPEKVDFFPGYETAYFAKFVSEPTLKERIFNRIKRLFK